MKQLFAVEKLVAVFALLAAALYRHFGIPPRTPLVLYWERLTEGAILYAVGVCLTLFLRRLSALQFGKRRPAWKHTLHEFKNDFLRPIAVFHDLRLINAVALVFVIFIQLKHLIPHVNPALWDFSVADVEMRLFGGRLLAYWVQNFLPGSWAQLMSDAYLVFYPFMAAIILYAVIQRDRGFANRFIFGFAVVWFVGILAVYAFPTWGPCFALPADLSTLPPTAVSDVQRQLWAHKLFTESRPEAVSGIFLISGFPSLHLAVPIFAATAFFPQHRKMSIFALVVTFLTCVSTLYFGWHYFIDDLGAFLLGGVPGAMARNPRKNPSGNLQ